MSAPVPEMLGSVRDGRYQPDADMSNRPRGILAEPPRIARVFAADPAAAAAALADLIVSAPCASPPEARP